YLQSLNLSTPVWCIERAGRCREVGLQSGPGPADAHMSMRNRALTGMRAAWARGRKAALSPRPASHWMVAVGAAALIATSVTLGLTQRSRSASSAPFRHLRLGTTVAIYPLTPLYQGSLWNRLVASGALHMPVLASRARDGAPMPGLARAWSVIDSG